jgi:hypothetical protein
MSKKLERIIQREAELQRRHIKWRRRLRRKSFFSRLLSAIGFGAVAGLMPENNELVGIKIK